jgi:Ca-activated chloride channel homolog
MSFIWPAMLALLLLVPLGVWGYFRLQRRRRALVEQSGGFGLPRAGAGPPLGRRRHIPPALFLAGLTILLLALARPQTAVSLPRVEGTVILTFDVSGSMAATDLEPTRMEAAKEVARAFVLRQPSTVEIGVVAFSDNGLAVQAPTNDTLAPAEERAPRLARDLPTPTPAPAREELGSSAVVVLFSDGENTAPPEPLEAAQAAAERGVRIYTVGIGTVAGTALEVEGFTVHTSLDEGALQQIAALTEGAYFSAERQGELDAIYDEIDLRLVVEPEQIEVTSLLAGLSVLLLLIGGACSLVWFSRAP